MTAVTFDTLKLARRLEGAGFTRAQADGAAEALADSLSNEIATKSDIVAVSAEISELRTEMRTSFAAHESKLFTGIAGRAVSHRPMDHHRRVHQHGRPHRGRGDSMATRP